MNGQLKSLPLELHDAICSFINAPHDLLALALACRKLAAFVIPNHLQYRYLCFDIDRFYLWNSLAQNRHIAAQCRTLYIHSEGFMDHPNPDQRLPSDLDFPIDHKTVGERTTLQLPFSGSHFDQVVAAIRNMDRLKILVWKCDILPPGIVYAAILKYCPDLENVNICLELSKLEVDELTMATKFPTSNPLQPLCELTRFTYQEGFRGHLVHKPSTMAHVAFLCSFLLTSQSLTSLCIHRRQHHADLEALFAVAIWPHLTQLSIDVFAIDSAETETRFFQLHPQIEHFAIRGSSMFHDFDFNDQRPLLPNLKSLDLEYIHSLRLNPPPSAFLGRLAYLSVRVDQYREQLETLLKILHYTSQMRTLVLRGFYWENTPLWLVDIAIHVPRLERLRIEMCDTGLQPMTESLNKDPSQLHNALSRLPNLTHLSMVSDGDSGKAAKIDDFDSTRPALPFNALCASSPALTHIEYTDEQGHFLFAGTRTTVAIQRSEGGEFVGYHIERRVEDWSPCYYGYINAKRAL